MATYTIEVDDNMDIELRVTHPDPDAVFKEVVRGAVQEARTRDADAKKPAVQPVDETMITVSKK